MVATSSLLEQVRHAKALVFDFDGTLVDSNPIKWRAFEHCFEEFFHRRDEILAYCWGNNHTPRGDKFRYVYEQILKLPYTPQMETKLHSRFEGETTRQIIEAPALPGAEEFLRRVRSTHATALLSSTPHNILLDILAQRHWKDYFQVVRGAPVDKANGLETFRQEHRLGSQGILFFGDTQEDSQAATEAGCTFIPVASEGPWRELLP